MVCKYQGAEGCAALMYLAMIIILGPRSGPYSIVITSYIKAVGPSIAC